jgi:hypothetical protein
MSPSLFRSTTSARFVVVALSAATAGWLATAGCGSTCGTDKAVTYGLVATGSNVSLVFGNFTAGANNDCPMPGGPKSVVSLTIQGTQMGSSAPITLCIPRPDELENGPLPLGSGVQFFDLGGTDGSCDYALDTSVPLTGTAKSIDMCDNGSDKSGFALEITGTATLMQQCATESGTINVTLAGTSAVLPMAL